MGVGKRRLILLVLVVLAVVMVSHPTVDAATGTEWIDVDSFDSTYIEWQAPVGASPYLDAQDHPTNYIRENKDELLDEGWFGFPDTTLTGTLTVNVSIWGFSDDTDDGVIVFVDETGSGGGSNAGTLIMDQNTGSYKTLALGEYTVSEVNLMRIFLRTTDTAMDDIEIDHMRLGVSGTAGGAALVAYPDGSLALGGTTSLVAAFVVTLAQGFALTGVVALAAVFAVTLVQGFGLGGTTALAGIYSKTLIEGFALGGTTSIFIIIQILLIEGFALTGGVSLAAVFVVTLVQGFALGGTTALAVAFVVTLAQGFSLAGTISAFKVFVVELVEGFSVGVGVDILKTVGTSLIGSLFFQLFLGLNMWGILGPMALVVGGYFAMKKNVSLGVIWFIVEVVVLAQYFALVEATPEYWWNIFIILLGSLFTIAFPLWGGKK